MGDEIVAGDAEADHVEDHDVAYDGVVIHEGRSVHKSSFLIKLGAKEAGESSHVWKDTVTAPI